MAKKTNHLVNGKYEYYRITRTVGHQINEYGIKIPIKKQFVGSSKKKALEKFEKFREEQKLKEEQASIKPSVRFSDIGERWLSSVFWMDASLSDNTKQLYAGAWEKWVVHSPFYLMNLEEINALMLQEWYNEADIPLSSLKAVNKVLRRFYKYLELEGYSRNMTASLVLPRHDDEPEDYDDTVENIVVWEPNEIALILGSFDMANPQFRGRFLLVLLANTGLRISEALALKFSDISLEDKTVRVVRQVVRPKGKSLTVGKLKSTSSRRIVPLNEYVLKELELHRIWQTADMVRNRYQTDFLFTTKTGKLYDRHNLRQSVIRYYQQIGVRTDRGFHCYRHTVASEMSKKGVPIVVASKILGHASIDVTAKYYINVSTEEKTTALENLYSSIE